MTRRPSSTVSMRELGSETRGVIDRVRAGEILTLIDNGEPIAELRPLPKAPLDSYALIEQWKNVPVADYRAMRAELSELIDPGL